MTPEEREWINAVRNRILHNIGHIYQDAPSYSAALVEQELFRAIEICIRLDKELKKDRDPKSDEPIDALDYRWNPIRKQFGDGN